MIPILAKPRISKLYIVSTFYSLGDLFESYLVWIHEDTFSHGAAHLHCMGWYEGDLESTLHGISSK